MQEVETRTNEVATTNQNLEDTNSRVNENTGFITEVQSIVENNQDRINIHETFIEALRSNMTTNSHDIQTLLDNFKDSLLRFHVETKIMHNYWPEETVVTYEKKVVDTHNAMNIESGIFTAPLIGVYGFFFYSEIDCGNNRYLYVYHNDLKINIQACWTDSKDDSVLTSNSVYFASEMKVGDTLKIFSGSALISLGLLPSKFMGFLLEKK